MSQAQIEQATQQLYEDMTIREELTDDESQVLLDWAEAQIQRLAAQEMDDAAFETAFAKLGKTLTRMGRLAAERDTMPPEDVQAGLQRIEETAAEVGLVPAEHTFLAQSAPGDVLGNVQALITYLSSGSTGDTSPDTAPDQPLASQPAPTDPPDEPPVVDPSEADTKPTPPASFFNRLASQLGEYLNGEEKPE